MRNISINKKGITLIELVLVAALIVVILVPISTFLISNYKVFNKGEKQIDAQQNAQLAMNLLISRAMEAKEMRITETSPYYKFEFDLGDSEKWIFSYDSIQNTLSSNNSKDSLELRVFAENIENLNVTEMNEKKGARFVIQSKVGDEVVDISNEVSFRNR